MSINPIFMEFDPALITDVRNCPLKGFLRFICPYFFWPFCIHNKTEFGNDILAFGSKQSVTLPAPFYAINIFLLVKGLTRWADSIVK